MRIRTAILTPAPLPPQGTRAYMYVANADNNTVYAYPVDTNNNPSFIDGQRTASNVTFKLPYYILLNSSNTVAYISDAPLNSAGKVYACDIAQKSSPSSGQLINCTDMQIANLNRPLSLALSNDNNNLYIANSTVNGGITACKLNPDGKTVNGSCQFNSNSSYPTLSPYGVAVNGSTAYVTYVCLNQPTCNPNNIGLGTFSIDANNNFTVSGTATSTSSLTRPSDLVYNSGNLYISNTTTNHISQFQATTTPAPIIGSSVSTYYQGNYEITVNSAGNTAYVANGGYGGGGSTSTKGYISKCSISGSVIQNQQCASLSYGNTLTDPLGVAITKPDF